MTNLLTSSILKIGNQFMDTYKRKSRASAVEQQSEGLTASETDLVTIPIAPVQEFVVFQTNEIKKGEKKTFYLNRWGEDLLFKSLYVENSSADNFFISVSDETGLQIIRQQFWRNRTPFSFPDNPLPSNLKITIEAINNISFIRLVAIPCKILDTFFAEEDYPKNEQRGGLSDNETF